MVVLYHSSPMNLENFIQDPILKASDHVQTINGVSDAYIFASNDKQMSLTYTVPKGVRLMNMTLENGSQIMLVDSEKEIGDPTLDGGIFTFQSRACGQLI
jgi:hypothetical protein